jgi:hypothetical protein
MRDGSIRAPFLTVLSLTFPKAHATSLTVSEAAKLMDAKGRFLEIESASRGMHCSFARFEFFFIATVSGMRPYERAQSELPEISAEACGEVGTGGYACLLG